MLGWLGKCVYRDIGLWPMRRPHGPEARVTLNPLTRATTRKRGLDQRVAMAAVGCFALLPALCSVANDVNVRDIGAVGDGQHLETAAINAAIVSCNESGGGRVIVPPGKYLTGTIELKSHVTLSIEDGATILASQN